jgi:hypothetical protein
MVNKYSVPSTPRRPADLLDNPVGSCGNGKATGYIHAIVKFLLFRDGVNTPSEWAVFVDGLIGRPRGLKLHSSILPAVLF